MLLALIKNSDHCNQRVNIYTILKKDNSIFEDACFQEYPVVLI